MDKIISDIDVLYNFFLEELHNRNINLRSDLSTDIADKNADIAINQPKIAKWLSSLTDSQKAEIVKLVKSTVLTFNSRKKKYRKETKSWLIAKQAGRIILIVLVVISLLLYSIWAFTVDNKLSLSNEYSPVQIISVFTVTICFTIMFTRLFYNGIKASQRELTQIDALSTKVSLALTHLVNNNVNNLNITTDTFALAIINFMGEYKKEVSKDKFGDFIKYTLLNEISFYFTEQEKILYRNIISNSTINNKDLIDFVDYIFSGKLILNDITIINNNITKYAFPNVSIINNQDELVKSYLHNLNNKIDNIELFKENQISIIIKNKLKNLIKYKEFTQDQILRQIKIKTDNPSDKIVNPDDVYKNYKVFINQLFIMIEEDNSRDTYLSNQIAIPSRFVSLTDFSNIYSNISIDHLENIRNTTNITISKINSYTTLYKYDLEKIFDDNATINQRFVLIAIMVILISGINIPTIVNIISGKKNSDDEENKKMFNWKMFASRDALEILWTNNIDIVINYIVVISLWAVICVTAIFYCINLQANGKSSLSKNKTNTSLLIDSLNDVQLDIDKLITLRKYILEPTDILSKKIISDKILDDLGYKYALNPENTNEIINITKYDLDDSVYNVYTFDQIDEQLTFIIYQDFVKVITLYEEPNFIKMKSFSEPFPIVELMINIAFFAISVSVLVMLYIFLNPISLLKDLQNLADCELDADKKIELLENNINKIERKDEIESNKIKITELRNEYNELTLALQNNQLSNLSPNDKAQKENNIKSIRDKIKNQGSNLTKLNNKIIKDAESSENREIIIQFKSMIDKLNNYNNKMAPLLNKKTELESKIQDETDADQKAEFVANLDSVQKEIKEIQENKDNSDMFSNGCRSTLITYHNDKYPLKLKIFTAASIVYVSIYYIIRAVSSTNF
jgi:hypothetical protein